MLIDASDEQDVVVVNKCDLVDAAQLRRIKALIKSLNPEADIVTSVRSQIDLRRVLNTNRFSFEKSMLSAGWLKSLQEEVKPETEEYGIGYAPSATLNNFATASRFWQRLCAHDITRRHRRSFVYRARRPFHPRRLWDLVRLRLVVIQDSWAC